MKTPPARELRPAPAGPCYAETAFRSGEAMSSNPSFATSHATSSVAQVSPLVRRIVAPNPGPFTDTGTCAYLVGARDLAIIDPGPADAHHIESILSVIGDDRLRYILVTHTHRDHSPAAVALKTATGAAVVGCAPYAAPATVAINDPGLDAAHDRDYAPDAILRDGEAVKIGGGALVTLATPGHTANHLCFALDAEKAVFTGDHVMRWSTTVVAPPDGSMRDYMNSIERQRARDDAILWPAHGGPIRHPQRYLRALLNHRRAREASILERLAAGDETIADIVARIYAGVDPRLHRAAGMTVLAHLIDLIARGDVAANGPPTPTARYWRP